MKVGNKIKFNYMHKNGSLKTYKGKYIPAMQPSTIKNLDSYIKHLYRTLKIDKIIGEIEVTDLYDYEIMDL